MPSGRMAQVYLHRCSEEKRTIEPMQKEPRLYPSYVYINVAMNYKVQKCIGAQTYI